MKVSDDKTIVLLFCLCQQFFEASSFTSSSRLKVSIDYPSPIAMEAMPDPSVMDGIPRKATIRMFDPKTGITYHRSNNTELIEALAMLWDPVYQPEKCGKGYTAFKGQGYTRLCDPEDWLLQSAARVIRNVTFEIPRVTGCQCMDYHHCSSPESGFSLHVVVVPTVLKPLGRVNWLSRVYNGSLVYARGILPESPIGDKLNFLVTKVKPVNLVVPRGLSGTRYKVIDENADIYDIFAHYIRSLLGTGECDEDMVICFFPKEKKLSISTGKIAFHKSKSACLNNVVAKAQRQLQSKSGYLSPEGKIEVLERNEKISLKLANEGFAKKVLASKQLKEQARMSEVIKTLATDISQLLLSRSENPCTFKILKVWSYYEITGMAMMTGIILSVMVGLFSRGCECLSDFIDKFIDENGKLRRRLFLPQTRLYSSHNDGYDPPSPLLIPNTFFKMAPRRQPKCQQCIKECNECSYYELDVISSPYKSAVLPENSKKTIIVDSAVSETSTMQSKKPTAV